MRAATTLKFWTSVALGLWLFSSHAHAQLNAKKLNAILTPKPQPQIMLDILKRPTHTFMNSGDRIKIKVIGNGGSGLLCVNENGSIEVELLDLFELRTVVGKQVSMNCVDATTWKSLAQAFANRFSKYSPLRAQRLNRQIDEFEASTTFIKGKNLELIPDVFPLAVPRACELVQIAVQADGLYTIDDFLWEKMDTLNKAALVLHELFYREAIEYGHPDSVRVRQLNGEILSDDPWVRGRSLRGFLGNLKLHHFFKSDIDGREVTTSYPPYVTTADQRGLLEISPNEIIGVGRVLPSYWKWSADENRLDPSSIAEDPTADLKATREYYESVMKETTAFGASVAQRSLRAAIALSTQPKVRTLLDRGTKQIDNGGDVYLCGEALRYAALSDETASLIELVPRGTDFISIIEEVHQRAPWIPKHFRGLITGRASLLAKRAKWLSPTDRLVDTDLEPAPSGCRRLQVLSVRALGPGVQVRDTTVDQVVWNLLDERTKALLIIESTFLWLLQSNDERDGKVAKQLMQIYLSPETTIETFRQALIENGLGWAMKD